MPNIRWLSYFAFACSTALLTSCATLGLPATPATASAQSAAATVQHADATLKRGDPNGALRELAALPPHLSSAVELQALDVQARAQLALGDRVAAARSRAERLPLLPLSAQAGEDQRIIAILKGAGASPLQAIYATLADGDPVKPYIREALASAGAGAARTLPQLNAPVGTVTTGSTPQGFVMPPHIALLLPATGPVAIAGAAVRDGFFAAYFHAVAAQQPLPTIKVYDTGGTPSGAVAAYQQAVSDGAALVIGPLGRASVAGVFAQPKLPIPVLALNHAQGNQPVPPGSAEFALLPEAEGAELAAHMVTGGITTAIVFRGSDSTATRTFAAFKAQFTSLGGQVADDIVLPQGAVDFEAQVKSAIAGAGSQTGIVALLHPTQARLLLPQLRLAQSTLPVFATSMVYSGDANITANTDLDGVQFSDEPWLYNAQAGLPNQAALAAQLTTASGPAARLFAFGMDAYALAPYLDYLHAHPGSYLAGATGQLTMDAAGHVQRTPTWVQFEGGVAQPVAAGLMPPPAATPAATPTGP